MPKAAPEKQQEGEEKPALKNKFKGDEKVRLKNLDVEAKIKEQPESRPDKNIVLEYEHKNADGTVRVTTEGIYPQDEIEERK